LTEGLITMRPASLDEASLVRDVVLAAYAEHKGALPVESSAYDETIEDVLDKMTVGGAVVAEDGGVAVGSTQFTPEDGYLYVGRVAVLPSHRRRGVASAMMRYLEKTALDLGRDTIRVGVRESLPNNKSFYASLGYEVVSTDPHPRGPDRTLTMVKRV
jgi:ribosomal protein S18 acetylase RimI-like enzyme